MQDERKFLHELSNPISSVFLMVDSVLESMKSRKDHSEIEVKHLKKAMDALIRVRELIQERKSKISQPEGSAPPSP